MGSIRATSATVAALYVTFLAFVILCIYNFTPVIERFNVENFNYGLAFLFLSLCGLFLGYTSGDVDDPFLRAFVVCLSAMWGALGTFYVTRDIPRPNAFLIGLTPTFSSPPSEALFPGYGAFFFIFLIFGFSCIQHQNSFTAVLSLGFFLCCIFEIAALWSPVRMSVGAYYLLLGAMVLYMLVKMLVDKLRGKDHKKAAKRLPTDNDHSNDYMAVGYAMDVIAFAVFASHVTGATTVASNAFMWVGSAGIFQTVSGVVAIRRKDPYCGSFFTLYGIFWSAVSFNLGLNRLSGTYDLPLLPVNIFFVFLFLLTSFVTLTREVFHSLQNILLAIFTIAICVNGVQGRFLGGMGWVCFLFSLYGLAAHLGRLKPTRYKLPLGRRLFDRAQLRQCLQTRLSCCTRCIYGNQKADQPAAVKDRLFSADFSDMGYSKYIDLDTIGFAVNAVSALSVLWIPANFTLLTLPWVSIVGGVAQMTVGCICFARGLTFESCSFIVFSTMWLILGTARSLDALALDNSVAMGVGSITYMVIGLLLIGLSLVISKAWFLVTFLFELIALAFLLNTLAVPSYEAYEIIVVLLFTLVCLYCFFASAFKSIWGRELLPTGSPIIQVSYLHSQGNRAFWAHAQKQSGVKAIAEIMNQGGIAGIPTDTVYVLAAPVKFPQAVERAYLTKKLAEDRPMSMWISNVNQLSAGREEFGEMLWDFMNAVWPSTISCVVSKGPWLDSLGIGYASKYVGRPDSIAVRMPDNTVTSFLIDQTGPVATTSANPTGEADTTHHLQVLAKLSLKNCDGILCDGPSFANSASTVVDCRKIDEGKIGFFRIGLVPKSRVEEIFERIQSKHRGGKSISRHLSAQSISETLDSGVYDRDPEYGGQINAAFVDDENNKINDNSNGPGFGESNGSSREFEIRPYVSSQMLRNMAVDGSLMKVKTSSEKSEQDKQNETIEPKFNEDEPLPDEQLNKLIKSLQELLHDSPGTNTELPLEQTINTLLTKLQNKPQLDNHAEDVDADDDYEKMNFGGKTNSIQTNDVHNTLNEVFNIIDANDGSDEPLTSLKSRRRRELQEEINKFVLSRGEKMNNKNPSKTVNGLNNTSDGIYTTTLEVSVDQNGHTHQTKPLTEVKFDSDDVMDSNKKSSAPLVENLASFPKQNDRETTAKKILHPPIQILRNDVAMLSVENVEKLRHDQINQTGKSSRPNKQDGDRVYSFNFTDQFSKRFPDRPKRSPPSPPPLLERVESQTQRTQL